MASVDLDDLIRLAKLRANAARQRVASAEAALVEANFAVAEASRQFALRDLRGKRELGVQMQQLLSCNSPALKVAQVTALYETEEEALLGLARRIDGLRQEAMSAEGRLIQARRAAVETERRLAKLEEAHERGSKQRRIDQERRLANADEH